jgi:nickel/cobalt exporter
LSGIFGIWAALIDLQAWIRQFLSAEITTFADRRDWLALASILPLGVAFGAVHAMTPGHGKTVLATYLVGSRMAVARACLTAVVLAATHVGTAVILAVTSSALVRRTITGAGQAPALEALSRGLLLIVGLWLLVRAYRGHMHGQGDNVGVGVIAGLIPCPLTLFVMFYALARGVPEVGLTFAVAMMLGIAIPLVLVAFLSVTMRDSAAAVAVSFGGSMQAAARLLDALAGTVLVLIGTTTLWR